MILTIIQNQKQKNVGRLGPNKGYERETSQRKQASEAGRLLWFLVGGITIAHHLGVKGESVTEWGRSFVVKEKICQVVGKIICLRLLVSRSYPLFGSSLSTFFSAFRFELWSKSF